MKRVGVGVSVGVEVRVRVIEFRNRVGVRF
jgi:hypothetical protein